MKTAVSVPDEDDKEITRLLSEIYADEPAIIDPAISRLAARILPKESWKSTGEVRRD